MADLLSSKRFIALVASVLALVFKDRLPISEDQLIVILTAVGSLIVGDSLNPIGKISDILKDPRVVAALAAIIVSIFQDRIPIAKEDLTNLIYLVASWIVGYSIRPPEVKPPAVDPATDKKAS